MLSKFPRLFRFSSQAFQVQAEKILSGYQSQAQALEEANASRLLEKTQEHLPRDGVYKHSYCTEEFPLSLESKHLNRAFLEFLGPEQISPHYQSFEEYGKWFTYFLLSFAFCFNMRDHYNHAFGVAMTNNLMGAEVYLYMAFFYILNNNAFSVNNPWKKLFMNYNSDQMWLNLYEDMELASIDAKKSSVAQVNFYRLHKEFLGMKQKLIANHIEVSKVELQKHAYQRVLSMLRMTESYEKDNFNAEFNTLLQDAISNIYQELQGEGGAEIRVQAFESALLGIKAGEMTYQNDPVLPVVLERIKEFEEKVNGMSTEDIVQMVRLRPQQKQSIRDSDRQKENEYIRSPPPLKHPALVAHPKFQSMVSGH